MRELNTSISLETSLRTIWSKNWLLTPQLLEESFSLQFVQESILQEIIRLGLLCLWLFFCQFPENDLYALPAYVRNAFDIIEVFSIGRLQDLGILDAGILLQDLQADFLVRFKAIDGFDVGTHHSANDFFVGLDVRARGTDSDRCELRPLAGEVHELAEPCLAAAERRGRRDQSGVDLPSHESGQNI